MRILAYMVTKNEADRYLDRSLDALAETVDGIFVYDDRSKDGTHDILFDKRVQYKIRPRGEPSFLEDESKFRQAAWGNMENVLKPKRGDWILTVDADEIVRAAVSLGEICFEAFDAGYEALKLRIHEVWNQESQIRVDGHWAQITGIRLARYKPNGVFKPQKLGGGSFPTGYEGIGTTDLVDIIHYGYARDEDKRTKYERYAERPGHSSTHIQSILQPPVLASLPELGYCV